jgi:hypothetical protein
MYGHSTNSVPISTQKTWDEAILQTKFSDRWQGNRSPKALSINGAENLSDEERLSGKTYADSGRSSHPNGFAIT